MSGENKTKNTASSHHNNYREIDVPDLHPMESYLSVGEKSDAQEAFRKPKLIVRV